MEGRVCASCGKLLVKKEGESEQGFQKRKNCDRECANKSRGQKRDGKLIYPSRFGGGFLAKGQYLAENMCDRAAKKTGLRLPERFWEKEWKSNFYIQLKYANGLLRKYSLEAIIAALRSGPGKKVYSLGAVWFEPLIAAEEAKIQRINEMDLANPPQAIEENTVVEPPRPAFIPIKSTLNKLRDL